MPETPEGRGVTEEARRVRDELGKVGLPAGLPAKDELAVQDAVKVLDALLSDHQALREREAARDVALNRWMEGAETAARLYAADPHADAAECVRTEIRSLRNLLAALSQTKEEPNG